MYLLHVTEAIQDPPLIPDTYVTPDACGYEICAVNPASARLTAAPVFQKKFRVDQDWNNKKILVTRLGAGGDIIFCTPALRYIKKTWPKAQIDFACFARFACLLENNPDVASVISHPVTLSQFNSYDAVVWLDDNFEEEREFGKTVPAIDLILKRFGIENLPDKDKELTYVVTDEEKAESLARFPRRDRKRICIQITASEPPRSWPKNRIAEFITLADKEGYDCFLLGWPREAGFEPPLSIRESAALLANSDGLVAPDSLWSHIGGALGISTVSLFAAFPSHLRISYAKSIFSVNERTGCNIAPCFHYSGRPGVHVFPENGPCATKGYCCAMAEIEPKRVLTLIQRQISEHPKK